MGYISGVVPAILRVAAITRTLVVQTSNFPASRSPRVSVSAPTVISGMPLSRGPISDARFYSMPIYSAQPLRKRIPVESVSADGAKRCVECRLQHRC